MFGILSVNQFQFFLVIQVVRPQTNPPGLDLHLPGKLSHTHVGLSYGMQARRTVHWVAKLDAVAGDRAVIQIQEADVAILPGDDNLLQQFLFLLGLVQVARRPYLFAPFNDRRLPRPAIAIVRLVYTAGASAFNLPLDLQPGRLPVQRSDSRVPAEVVSPECQYAHLSQRILGRFRHMDQFLCRPVIVLLFLAPAIDRHICNQVRVSFRRRFNCQRGSLDGFFNLLWLGRIGRNRRTQFADLAEFFILAVVLAFSGFRLFA